MRSEADHPAPAELLAVYLGTLDPEERDPIEEHLSKCPECAQTVLDFEAFPHLRAVDEGDAEVTRRLEDQKRRLIERSREETFERNETSQRSRSVPWFASPAVAWGVAAVFFLATVGLGVWREGLSQEGIGQVFPATVTRTRGDEEPLRIFLAGERSRIRLQLQEASRHFPEYRVTLEQEQTGVVVESSSGFLLQENSTSLVVVVPHRIVSPGFYRFEVEGLGSEEEEEEYVGLVRVEFISASEMQTRTE